MDACARKMGSDCAWRTAHQQRWPRNASAVHPKPSHAGRDAPGKCARLRWKRPRRRRSVVSKQHCRRWPLWAPPVIQKFKLCKIPSRRPSDQRRSDLSKCNCESRRLSLRRPGSGWLPTTHWRRSKPESFDCERPFLRSLQHRPCTWERKCRTFLQMVNQSQEGRDALA